MAYRVSPFQKEDSKTEAPLPNSTESRLALLEEKLTQIINNGGKFDGLI
jgi:hypothetical protein